MATKKSSTELEPIAKSELAVRPSFIPQGVTGTEHIGRDDMQVPRLALAQSLSPEMLSSEPKFIEGLTVGDMFNSLTGEIYGKGPLEFTIVRADKPRGIEFYPREEGGGIRDMNVPLTDSRMQFTTDGNGKTVKPIATKFYDFFVMLLPVGDNAVERVVALSLKSSQLKTAKRLNTLVRMRGTDLYAGKYVINSAMEKGPKGTYAIFQVDNANWPDEATFGASKALFEMLKDKTVGVHEREAGDDSFDTADM